MTTRPKRASGSRPASTNAWLLVGDEASLPELELMSQPRRSRSTSAWTAPKHAQAGDLLFFYFMAPIGEVRYAARCVYRSYYDNTVVVASRKRVDPHKWWALFHGVVALEPVPLNRLKVLMGGSLVLRGSQSRYLRPDVVRGLMGATSSARELKQWEKDVLQLPVGEPDLPDPSTSTLSELLAIADGAFAVESQVEQHIVEPLLRLALLKDKHEIQRQYRTAVGVPDYVVTEGGTPTAVIEVKLAVRWSAGGGHTGARWSGPDLNQVLRYARHLDVPAVLADSSRVWLVPRGSDQPSLVLERRSLTASDLDVVSAHVRGGVPEAR